MGSMNQQKSVQARIAVGGAIVTPKGDVLPKITISLAMRFLELAKTMLKRCERRKGSRSYTDILGVYIMVVVSLESFINEICLEKIREYRIMGNGTKCLEEIMYGNNGRGMEIREKWECLPICLWDQEPNKRFDKDTQLWQEFDALIRLRNALVHYKAEYQKQDYIPEYLPFVVNEVLSSPQKQRQFQSSSEIFVDATQHWIIKVSNVDMGYWAFDTGIGMIDKFLSFTDQGEYIYLRYNVPFKRLICSRTTKTLK